MSIKEEVRASAAAYRDLGPGYDAAVAEGLVERIGEEIDKRVDARLFGQMGYQAPSRGPRARREPVPGGGAAGWRGGGGVAAACCWASARWAWPSGPPRWCFIRAIPPASSAAARRS